MEDRSVPWSCRIQAASFVADRAFGRAPQSVSLEVTRRLNELTLDESRLLEARLAGEQQLTIDVTAGAQAEASSAIAAVMSLLTRVRETTIDCDFALEPAESPALVRKPH